MLIYFRLGDLIMFEHDAGIEHLFDQRLGLSLGQTVEKSGHQPCRHLVIRDLASGVTADQICDLVAGQFSSVALLFNQVLWSHNTTSPNQNKREWDSRQAARK